MAKKGEGDAVPGIYDICSLRSSIAARMRRIEQFLAELGSAELTDEQKKELQQQVQEFVRQNRLLEGIDEKIMDVLPTQRTRGDS